MLKNYFRIAIAVLKRRKFFTFISLFGISFTLTILVVLSAFIDKILNDNYPDKKRNRSLYINHLSEIGEQSFNGGRLSHYFIDHYIGSLKTPEKLAFSSSFQATNTYVNNKKITINYKYTDSNYWEVTDYEFLEGKAFTAQQIKDAEKVGIISEATKLAYFGNVSSVVGQYIEADNIRYRVQGVVKNVPITLSMFYGDLYLPYTVSKIDVTRDKDYRGNFFGILLAPSSYDLKAMQAEYDAMLSKVPMSDSQFNRIYAPAETFIYAYLNTGNDKRNGFKYALTALGVFILLVMLLPTLNLVNINITRIMERSSEIGVRKAFGASSKTLVYQFLTENLILTFLGGMIGLLFSFIIIQVLNRLNLIDHLQLSLSLPVFVAGILICLVFGLVSGVYPAWRMSKLHVVSALKAQ